jgi:hypothetical protein
LLGGGGTPSSPNSVGAPLTGGFSGVAMAIPGIRSTIKAVTKKLMKRFLFFIDDLRKIG